MSDAAGASTTGTTGDTTGTGAGNPAAPGTEVTGTPTPADIAARAAAATAPGTGEPAAVVGVDTTGWPAEAITALAKAQANAAKYQREAGDSRINAKNTAREEGMQKAARAFAEAAGLEIPSEDAEVTVESVQSALQETGKTLAETQQTAATLQAAWQNGVAPAEQERLEFKLSRHAEFKALDTTDAEYSSKVGTIVAALVAADPSLKLTGSVVISGVESLGGASGSTTITQDAFNAMSITEKTALYHTDKATYDALARNAK